MKSKRDKSGDKVPVESIWVQEYSDGTLGDYFTEEEDAKDTHAVEFEAYDGVRLVRFNRARTSRQ